MSKNVLKNNKKSDKQVRMDYAVVVFLDYIKKYPITKHFLPPSYFKEELHIDDARALLRKLEKRKYIIKDKNGHFTITSKGERKINSNGDYLKFFETAVPYVDILDYNKRKEEKYDISFEKIMIAVLLEKIKQLEEQDHYIGVKNLHYDIGELYYKIDFKGQAVYHYLVSLYFEISGLQYYDKFLDFIQGKCKKKDVEEIYEHNYIDPYIIESIIKVGDVYYDDMSDTVFERNKITINLCTREKFKELVNDIITQTYDTQKWQKYFRKTFNGMTNAIENEIKYKN